MAGRWYDHMMSNRRRRNTTVSREVHGLRELLETFAALPENIRKRIGGRGMRRAMAPIESRAVQLAPVDAFGHTHKHKGEELDETPLADRFKMRARHHQGRSQVVLHNTAPHAHLQEYGWWHTSHKPAKRRIRYIGKNDTTGPNPFMRPALEEKGDEALKILADEVEKAIFRHQKREAKKARGS